MRVSVPVSGDRFSAALIQGEDRGEVLSPKWKPLQRLNDIKPLHPLIQEVAQGSFSPEAASGDSRIGLGGQEPGGVVVGLPRCRHV